jgi:hypothetical protein
MHGDVNVTLESRDFGVENETIVEINQLLPTTMLSSLVPSSPDSRTAA